MMRRTPHWRPGASRSSRSSRPAGQKLFFCLPDLAKMEVMAYIHESRRHRGQEGDEGRGPYRGALPHPARLRQGHVTLRSRRSRTKAGNWISDASNFAGWSSSTPGRSGLKPDDAEVEFRVRAVCLRNNVRAVLPSAASRPASEHSHNVCTMAGSTPRPTAGRIGRVESRPPRSDEEVLSE